MKISIYKRISICISMTIILFLLFIISGVSAQSDPSAEITSIINRVITIATRVGSGILLLFIVKDAFVIIQNRSNPEYRSMMLRDIFFLIIEKK